MLVSLLLANLLHGLVAMTWLAGLRRFAGPLSPRDEARLCALALVLPVLLAGVGLIGGPHAYAPLLRVNDWASAIANSHPLVWVALAVLLAGTATIFVAQEVVPLWIRRRRHWRAPRGRDPRIDTALGRVVKRFAQKGLVHRWGRTPRALRLDSPAPIAGLVGIVEPTVLISRALLEHVNDEQLDAVMAHELAHSFEGGNLKLLVLWLVRSLQAPSPAALVLHRNFVQLQEEACDAVAARVTARPLALAEVLLLVARHAPPSAQMASSAPPATVDTPDSSDQFSTRLRVRGLLDRTTDNLDASAFVWVSGLALGGLLWSIG